MEALMSPVVTGHRRLPNSLTHNDHKCQNCREPGANMVCANCKVEDIGSLSIRYCSRDCQKEHWQEHKKICNDRRRLTRATRILNAIWETFGELTYVNRVTFGGKAGRVIHATCLSHNEPLNHGGWTGETIFRDFAQGVLGGNQDEEVKQALLHDSDDALSTGLGLIRSLLQPVCSKITEVLITTKSRALVVEVEGLPSTDAHTILLAKLESGEEFSVDLVGAQFGWQEKIYTWQSFTQHRAESIDNRWALGGTNLHEAMVTCTDIFPPDQLHRAAYDLRREIAQDVAKSITAFFSEKQTNVWNFMSQANSTFQSQSAELVSKATMAIHDSIREMTVERGIGRWYVEVQPSKFALKVIRDEALARRMKRVWLSQKHVDKVQLKFAHLPKQQMEKACLERLSDIVMKRWVKSMYCRRG